MEERPKLAREFRMHEPVSPGQAPEVHLDVLLAARKSQPRKVDYIR